MLLWERRRESLDVRATCETIQEITRVVREKAGSLDARVTCGWLFLVLHLKRLFYGLFATVKTTANEMRLFLNFSLIKK